MDYLTLREPIGKRAAASKIRTSPIPRIFDAPAAQYGFEVITVRRKGELNP